MAPTPPPPQLTYNGHPIILDLDGAIQKHCDEFYPVDDVMRDAELTVQQLVGRGDTTTGDLGKSGLPRPNYPARPKLKLNQLYWPTGATRWCAGVFLVTGEAAAAAIALAGNARFVYSDGEGNTLDTPLKPLAPRPVTIITELGEGMRLYLLPLVCERFFWQFKAVESLTLSSSTTWATLLTQITNAAGSVTGGESPHASYQRPDLEEWARHYETVGVLLDAYAWSTGQRIFWETTGLAGFMKFGEGSNVTETAYTSNYTKDVQRKQIGGGEYVATMLPEKVRCIFPWLADSIPCPHRIYARDESPPSGVTVKTLAGTKQIIRCTLWATGSDTTSTPSNSATLIAAAQKVAEDYYRSQAKKFDHVFAGYVPWRPTGWDDYKLYSFGQNLPGALVASANVSGGQDVAPVEVFQATKYQTTTRVASLPQQVWPETQSMQTSGNQPLRGPQLVNTDGFTLNPGGTNFANVFVRGESSYVNTGRDITVTNLSPNVAYTDKDSLIVAHPIYGNNDDDSAARWVVVPTRLSPTRITGTLAAHLLPTDGITTSTYTISYQGEHTPTGSLNISNPYFWAGRQGATWEAERNESSGNYEIIRMEDWPNQYGLVEVIIDNDFAPDEDGTFDWSTAIVLSEGAWLPPTSGTGATLHNQDELQLWGHSGQKAIGIFSHRGGGNSVILIGTQQLPADPGTGTFTLKSVNSVLTWVSG